MTSNGEGLLLDFAQGAPLRERARGWDARITYVAGDAEDMLGLEAVLVRPDGFVAWASDIAPDPAQAVQAALRWFGAAG